MYDRDVGSIRECDCDVGSARACDCDVDPWSSSTNTCGR